MNNATRTLTSEVESVMETLCGLLDRESDAVQASDFNTFRSIQNDKHALLTRYRALMDTLQRQSGALKTADKAILDRLKLAAKKFKVSTDRNASALEAGRNSMQRIVDRIVKCARDTVHANRQSYTKQGHAHLGSAGPLSIQVNEVL